MVSYARRWSWWKAALAELLTSDVELSLAANSLLYQRSAVYPSISFPLMIILHGMFMCDLHFTVSLYTMKASADSVRMIWFCHPIYKQMMLILYPPWREGKSGHVPDFLLHCPLRCLPSLPPCLLTAVIIPWGRPCRLLGSVDDYRNNLFSNGC